MSKEKDAKLEEIAQALEGIREELENLCDEVGNLSSILQITSFMLISDKLSETRPELREKIQPLINEWINALDLAEGEE